MKRITDNIATILVVCTLLGMAFGAFNHFAPLARLEALEQQYAYDKMATRMEKVQERIWLLEERYKTGGLQPAFYPPSVPKSVMEELRELKSELGALKAKLKID